MLSGASHLYTALECDVVEKEAPVFLNPVIHENTGTGRLYGTKKRNGTKTCELQYGDFTSKVRNLTVVKIERRKWDRTTPYWGRSGGLPECLTSLSGRTHISRAETRCRDHSGW